MIDTKTFRHIESDTKFTSLKVHEREGIRYYKTPTGVWLPSVTTVTGWSKREFFKEWLENPENQKESIRCLTRGNQLHELVEDYLNNKDTLWGDKIPIAVELFNQLKPELNRIDNIQVQEVPLWSENVGVAGRVDCIADFDGKLSIIDFKGSTKSKREDWIENYFHQATAYALMFQEQTGMKIENIVIMIANEDGTNQIFVKKPLSYVKGLYESIKTFYEDNGWL